MNSRGVFFDRSLRRLVSNSSWTAGAAGVVAVAGIGETILLARYLTPSELGLLFLIFAYPEAVQQLLDFRTRDAVTRYLGEFLARDDRERAAALIKLLWLVDVAVAAAAYAIVLATAGLAAHILLGDSDRSGQLVLYGIALLLGSADTASGSMLRVAGRFRLASLVGSTAAVVRVGLIAAAVAVDAGIWGLIWARVLAELATTLLQGVPAFWVLREILWKHRAAPVALLRDRFGEIARFLFSTSLTGAVRMASSKLDTLLLGVLATPATVGLYKIAVQLGTGVLRGADALFATVYPEFARLHGVGREQEIRSLRRKASVLVAALVLPIAVVVVALSSDVLRVLVGHAYTRAALPFAIILVGVLPTVCFFWVRALLLARGRSGAVAKIELAGTVVQLGTLVALAPILGVTGAALSVAALFVVVLALQLGESARADREVQTA